ncbi:MAG TPA: WecB/TagA/CpsF family glycosyltransferase [Rhizomicrobium sp.]|nr:WecB/TagA/CpsF family glycosyltransferase [Rhizomicrobium sp.]
MTAQAADRPYPEVIAGGLRVACIGCADLTRLMVEECLNARKSNSIPPKLVFGVNGQAISLAARDAELRRHHELADHVHADGQPLVLAARFLAKPRIPERSAVTDFFHDAAIAAREHGLRFFLLGATDENNAACARVMQTLYPGLVIAGRRHGYFRLEDEPDICAEINQARADIVWVGLGTPLEQAFCVRNRHRIRAGWLVGAGGCFNYVSGHYSRAPRWMQLTGLEWLHRLWREPRRLFWRYAVTNPHALCLLLTRTSSLRPPQAGPAVGEVRTAGSAG